MDFDFRLISELQPFFQSDVRRTRKVLGKGSFGTVELVTLSGAPCAAKKLHSILTNLQASDRKKVIEKFKKECQIMSMLRHPNIVQFLGLCTFEDTHNPVILMECLDICLHQYLTKEGKDRSLALSTKISILLDVASGLAYLHWHNPPIIHRDLTANNVLLSLPAVQAKISDMGNSRIMNMHSFAAFMTQTPGTVLYMPPEAMEDVSKYNSKLDVFSFGHLALFTMLQVFPCNLLAATHMHKGKLQPRSEVHRRSEYFIELKSLLGSNHSMVKLIEGCLDNIPQNRPSARHILEELNKQPNIHEQPKCDRDTTATGIDSVRLEAKISLIRHGSPGWLEYATTQGRRREVIWRKQLFQITNTTHLQYFKNAPRTDRATGELRLSQISQVQKMIGLRFSISFDGRGSPWILKASDEEERICWMEAILPGSSQLYGRTPDIETPQQDSYEYNRSRWMKQPPEPAGPIYDTPLAVPNKHDYGPRPPSGYQKITNQPDVPEYDQVQHGAKQPGFYEDITFPPAYDRHGQRGANQPGPGLYDDITLPRKSEVYRHQDSFAENLRATFSEEQYAELTEMLRKLNQDNTSDRKKKTIAAVPQTTHTESTKPNYMNVWPQPPVIQVEDAEPTHYPLLTPNDSFRHSSCKKTPRSSPRPSPLPSPRHSPYPSPNTSPEHTTYRKRTGSTLPPQQPSMSMLLRQWGPSSARMLVTDDEDDDADYHQLPEWSRARTDFSGLSNAGLKFEVPNIREADLLDMQKIGSGEFGYVYKAQLRTRGYTQVAVKTIKRYESETETRDFMREMGAMSQVMHPNIIKLYGLVQEKFWLVIEYMSNKDLKSFLIKNKRPMRALVKYMIDVSMGMHYLFEKGLLHRDLAARNVMVSENEVCKVADFGLMRQLPNDEEYYIASTPGKQPIRWMAPESISEKKYSPASDVWSFGVLVWEMLNPTTIPYEGMDNMQCVIHISSGYTLPIPPDCPSTVAKIMKACWQKKASKRPSFLLISMFLTNMNFHA